ncbi:MAG: cell wall-active antibiotics response protein [Chitinophagales bacterium]|nr:cell wall-active antibiotics response protein [Chitinophagales bacterium]
MERIDRKNNHSNIWVGLIVLLIGAGWFLQKLNFLTIPHWLVSWPMLLIGVGIISGIRNNFKNALWFIMILIGSIFLVNDLMPQWQWHQYLWPLGLIAVGIFLILKPKRGKWNAENNWNNSSTTDGGVLANEDVLDCTTFFGGLKKNVLSKNFKGGEVVTVFGGTEINFTHADIQGRVVLEVTQIFGGTKLIVPSNWEIKSEVTSIFGGISDKRPPNANALGDKILILDGTSIFGGIEIVSY